MKTSACLVVAVILATVMANVVSMTVREQPASSSTRVRLGRGLITGEALLPERDTKIWTSEEDTANTMRVIGVTREDSRNAVEACMTQEQCNKKKVVCSKKCFDSAGNEVEKQHHPAAKCIVKCKKCVPDC